MNTLDAIKKYFKQLANNQGWYLNITSQINKKTNVVSYLISDIDLLYYFLMPYLKKLSFQSRKKIDFELLPSFSEIERINLDNIFYFVKYVLVFTTNI